jgi:hypothetical protein
MRAASARRSAARALRVQGASRRRVDRLVAVVPRDPVARRLLAHDLAHGPGVGRSLRGFGLDDDAVSDLEAHELLLTVWCSAAYPARAGEVPGRTNAARAFRRGRFGARLAGLRDRGELRHDRPHAASSGWRASCPRGAAARRARGAARGALRGRRARRGARRCARARVGGRWPVVNAHLKPFAATTGRRVAGTLAAKQDDPQLADHPATDVTRADAEALCAWASLRLGRRVRLPSADEWEALARGTDASPVRSAEREPYRSRRKPLRRTLAPQSILYARDPVGAGIAGTPPAAGERGSGLEQLYDARLAGRPAAELRFGERVIARAPGRRPRSVHATIRPGLQRASVAALGDRLGGVAVLRPRSGDVLALAGLAVSAPQPPGSTFKIVTLAGALDAGITKPSSVYPVRTSATLSGVRLRNASNESCGGTLVASFAHSCNSVFAPLGARLGAQRLVRTAEAFGFNERPRVPAAKASRISRELKDSHAVGAAAIGQDRDLATPLQMASVGATIAAGGMRARPRIVREEPVVRRRAARARTARQVRSMMLAVVRGGTGTAAAIPGVEVAGKTGTAELRPTAGAPADPKNTDAWFVAFAPAHSPRVAVAVMLIGAGAGGQAAAPIARRVLQAAL